MAGTSKNVRWVEEPKMGLFERMYLPAIAQGLSTTVRHIFRPQVKTEMYPEVEPRMVPNYRGVHRLNRDERGRVKCVACYMCATACPAQCIYIEAGEYPDDPIEKYPVRFVIDELRCIFCGFCVEACPKDAIRMDTGVHVPPSETREAQVWDQTVLLQGRPVSYESDPWLRREAPGIPADMLARMRETARPWTPCTCAAPTPTRRPCRTARSRRRSKRRAA